MLASPILENSHGDRHLLDGRWQHLSRMTYTGNVRIALGIAFRDAENDCNWRRPVIGALRLLWSAALAAIDT
jgi:hypothetical protein